MTEYFSMVILSSQSIYENRETKTQLEIDDATNTLDISIDNFQNSVIKSTDNRIQFDGRISFSSSRNPNFIVVSAHDYDDLITHRRTVSELKSGMNVSQSSDVLKIIPISTNVTSVEDFDNVTESLGTDPVLNESLTNGVVKVIVKSISGKLRSYEVVATQPL